MRKPVSSYSHAPESFPFNIYCAFLINYSHVYFHHGPFWRRDVPSKYLKYEARVGSPLLVVVKYLWRFTSPWFQSFLPLCYQKWTNRWMTAKPSLHVDFMKASCRWSHPIYLIVGCYTKVVAPIVKEPTQGGAEVHQRCALRKHFPQAEVCS